MSAQHAAAVAEVGGLVGAWPCGITSRSLADFGTEIIRLAEAAGPDHVGLGTDLDGNYRPVLTIALEIADISSAALGHNWHSRQKGQVGRWSETLWAICVFTPPRLGCEAVQHGGSIEP